MSEVQQSYHFPYGGNGGVVVMQNGFLHYYDRNNFACSFITSAEEAMKEPKALRLFKLWKLAECYSSTECSRSTDMKWQALQKTTETFTAVLRDNGMVTSPVEEINLGKKGKITFHSTGKIEDAFICCIKKYSEEGAYYFTVQMVNGGLISFNYPPNTDGNYYYVFADYAHFTLDPEETPSV
jgi:hypothetical protein